MPVHRTRYNLFDHGVASELELPLPKCNDPVRTEVVLGHVPDDGALLFATDGPVPFACYRKEEAIILAWTDVRFEVVPGRVVVDAEDHLAAAHLLVPAVWSVVLSAHNQEALHGSAVEHEGLAVAILGHSGSGKTTAAQGLINRGWRLVSDDMLTFDDDLRVVPGPPWMRFLPGHSSSWPGNLDIGGKIRVYPPTRPQPTPLAAMVIMAPEHERFVQLSGISAAAALLHQVYNPLLTHSGQVQRRFDLVHGLADHTPVYGAAPRSLSAEQLLEVVAEKVQ